MSVPVSFVGKLARAVGTFVGLNVFVHVHMINIMSSIQETFPTNCTNVSFHFLKVNDVLVLPESTVGCKARITVITPETFPCLNKISLRQDSFVGCGSSRLMTKLLHIHRSRWLEMDCWRRMDLGAESSNIPQQWSWKYMYDTVRCMIVMAWNSLKAPKTPFQYHTHKLFSLQLLFRRLSCLWMSSRGMQKMYRMLFLFFFNSYSPSLNSLFLFFRTALKDLVYTKVCVL